jgi:hypothetical protein
MATTTEGEIRQPQDMTEGMKKAMKTSNFLRETAGEGEAKVLGSFGRRYAIWSVWHPLCLPRREKSFQPPDEGLQNLPKIAKRHGFKPRSTAGRKKHKSRISNATTRKTAGVKSIYISNDPTSAKVKERKEEHIKTGQPGNNITTSYYGVSKMVRSTS